MSDQLEQFLSPAVEEKQSEPEVTQETAIEEPAVAAEPQEEPWTKAAYLAEKEKRQRAEQAANELAAKLAKQEEEEKPYLGEEYEARFKDTESKFQNALIQQKLDLSESFAREKYADWDDKLVVFADMIKENPALYQQMIQQANPAEFAYKTANNQQKLKEMGDPSEYEKNLRAKIEAELKQKYEKQSEQEAAKRDELPGSLAITRGASGTHSASWAGPTDLKDVLG